MPFRKLIADGFRLAIGSDRYTRLRMGRKPEHSYLRDVRGIIHVGANTGQERDLYSAFGLQVIWIEPIPDIFRKLRVNITNFPKQCAFNYLVTEEDGSENVLHIADNEGASSSILELSKHTEMWPEISYTGSITLKGITLGKLLAAERVDIHQFDALVLDTQGSELGILAAARNLLPNFDFIKVEAPDFESYKGCSQVDDLSAFLLSCGFSKRNRVPFMHKPGLGTYFDVIYSRSN